MTPDQFATVLVIGVVCTFFIVLGCVRERNADAGREYPGVTPDDEVEAWNERAERLVRLKKTFPAVYERLERGVR